MVVLFAVLRWCQIAEARDQQLEHDVECSEPRQTSGAATTVAGGLFAVDFWVI